MTTDHGQLTLRDYVSYYLAKRRARKVMRRRRGSPEEYIVVTDRDDGRSHLVSRSAMLCGYVEGFHTGFTTACDITVHPPDTDTGGWESGSSSPPKTGPLCQRCVQRLPVGAHIRRAHIRRPVGEPPAPRGEGRG